MVTLNRPLRVDLLQQVNYSRPMATNVIRTKTEEATDALAAIRDAEIELARMRQHIERARAEVDPTDPGVVYQALHSGEIVEAKVAEALKHTRAMRSIHLAQASS